MFTIKNYEPLHSGKQNLHNIDTTWPDLDLCFSLHLGLLLFRMSSVHFCLLDNIAVKLILICIKFHITGR